MKTLQRELVCVALIAMSSTSYAQAPRSPRIVPRGPDIDSLLYGLRSTWQMASSTHFTLYSEPPRSRLAQRSMLKQLEAAWTHDSQLIGVRMAENAKIIAVITVSPTAFPSVMSPQNKGLATRSRKGVDVVFLVHNDTVRPYTRHEVMHVIARRAFGQPTPSADWLVEGLATYADGRCQSSTIAAVARDILLESPNLSIADITEHFGASAHENRARAYVLAGSLVGYEWSTRGIAGVQALWQGRDSVEERLREGKRGPHSAVTRTTAWRQFVLRSAGKSPGVAAESLRRFGCG